MKSWDRLLRVIWCLISIFYRMALTRNKVSRLLAYLAIISRDDYVIMILLCCFDCSGRHIVPQVAVKSLCAQPVQKGRYLRIREGWKVFLESPLFALYLRSPPKTGRWTADLYQKNLRSYSGGETRLRIEAVRDLTELNWTGNHNITICASTFFQTFNSAKLFLDQFKKTV